MWTLFYEHFMYSITFMIRSELKVYTFKLNIYLKTFSTVIDEFCLIQS